MEDLAAAAGIGLYGGVKGELTGGLRLTLCSDFGGQDQVNSQLSAFAPYVTGAATTSFRLYADTCNRLYSRRKPADRGFL